MVIRWMISMILALSLGFLYDGEAEGDGFMSGEPRGEGALRNLLASSGGWVQRTFTLKDGLERCRLLHQEGSRALERDRGFMPWELESPCEAERLFGSGVAEITFSPIWVQKAVILTVLSAVFN